LRDGFAVVAGMGEYATLVRPKIPDKHGPKTMDYLRSTLAPDADPKKTMDEIGTLVREQERDHVVATGDRFSKAEIKKRVTGMAIGHVYRAYRSWRRKPKVTSEVGVAFMTSGLLAELDADTRKTVEDPVMTALKLMGPERAEILLLRHRMGFGARCADNQISENGMDLFTYGGIAWNHPSRMILPCPNCIGENSFTDDRIAQMFSIDEDRSRKMLDEARGFWVERSEWSRNGGL